MVEQRTVYSKVACRWGCHNAITVQGGCEGERQWQDRTIRTMDEREIHATRGEGEVSDEGLEWCDQVLAMRDALFQVGAREIRVQAMGDGVILLAVCFSGTIVVCTS